MKAQVIKQFGSPDVFTAIDVTRPEVIPGHVLIRVAASSVNQVDLKIRKGSAQAISPEFPAVLHGDVAGVIEEVGEGVRIFKIGDEVYGCAGGVKGHGGALAEFMLADADLIAHKPKSLSMAEAAALPSVAITAWDGLIDRALINPGQNVLVHAATGGVGHIGLQLAKSIEAKVFVTSSNDAKLVIARNLGADVTINYRKQTVTDYVNEYTDGKGFDVVFDTKGADNLPRSFQAATLNGTVISTSTSSVFDLSLLHTKGLTLHVVSILIPMLYGIERAKHGQILTEIAKLVDAKRIHPLIDPMTFKFSSVAEAHQYAESGRAIGKVTLTW